MKYLSVCSGIEAASVAWHPLGFEAVGYSEIDKFPSAVLAHRFPETPNYGDMTKYKEWPIERGQFDILVGGTPCQSFSVAGLRQGLKDPRGNLMLTYGAIANHFRPRWIVWENVPGVLSSSGGRDFGAFLGMLAELGYGFSYRILDAQYVRVESHKRAVPQRRRRVFVVGYLGDWRRAAAVLFESESLSRYTPPSRKAGERIAACLTRGAESSGKGGYAGRRREDDSNIVAGTLQNSGKAAGSATQQDAESGMLVAHTLRGEGFDAGEDGTGRGTPWVAGYHTTGAGYWQEGAGTLRAREQDSHENIVADTITSVFHKHHGASGGKDSIPRNHIAEGSMVRRLTPVEVERLQGFPDNWTRIPWRGKPADQCPDGPRYKAIGNSMAVNVMRWIGDRIVREEGRTV